MSDVAMDDRLDAPLWGVKAIAAEIGKTYNATAWLVAQGHIPARKVGRSWVTSRRRLREMVAPESAGATNA